jgi:hypothetical protein
MLPDQQYRCKGDAWMITFVSGGHQLRACLLACLLARCPSIRRTAMLSTPPDRHRGQIGAWELLDMIKDDITRLHPSIHRLRDRAVRGQGQFTLQHGSVGHTPVHAWLG